MNRRANKSVKLQPKSRAMMLGRQKVVPELRISGAWLDALGFHAGEMVDISIYNRVLVIKALG